MLLFRYTAGTFSVLLWMWQSVCSSYCHQLNAVSFSTTLHVALYRSIYSLLTWSSLGTLQGFLGAFTKFQKATICFVMSVRPSACPHAATRFILHELSWKSGISIFFEKISTKHLFHENLSRIKGTLHKNLCTFIIISHSDLPRLRNISDKTCLEIYHHHHHPHHHHVLYSPGGPWSPV
jgi:hypothetical protein